MNNPPFRATAVLMMPAALCERGRERCLGLETKSLRNRTAALRGPAGRKLHAVSCYQAAHLRADVLRLGEPRSGREFVHNRAMVSRRQRLDLTVGAFSCQIRAE